MKTPFHYMLALMMLVTGSINTLTTRAADKVVVENRHGQNVPFTHPLFQAACMFLGEALCLIVHYLQLFFARRTAAAGGKQVQEAKPFNKFLLMIPAACDMTATSTMYIGLTLTYASSFQMLRGCVVIFTGFASCIFLKRKLRLPHWLGMILVTGGTLAVGTATLVCKHDNGEAKNAILGNLLIIFAQVIVAAQMVIEEKLIGGFNMPALQVVGMEGIFGFSMLTCVLIILYHVPQPSAFKALFPLAGSGLQKCPIGGPSGTPTQCYATGDHFEDAIDAFVQLGRSGALVGYTLGTICSIAFFNFSGVSITKHLNAATRMVLDSLRTIVIWAFSMGVKWQTFCFMDVVGFCVLLLGTVIFNKLLKLPGYTDPDETASSKKGSHSEPLLDVAVEPGALGAESPALPVMDQLLTPSMQKLTHARKN